MKKLLLVAGVLSLSLWTGIAAADNGTALTLSSAPWTGFGSDFNVYWEGNTTVVSVTPAIERALAGTSATCCLEDGSIVLTNFGYFAPVQRWTVNRVSSSASASDYADAEYSLLGHTYSANDGDSASNLISNWAQMAQYADVATNDGRQLAGASAVAYQDTDFEGQSFTASGQVSSAAMLRNGSRSASGTAQGSSCFDATYEVDKPTPFSFSLDMAELGSVDLEFSAIDAATQKPIWSLARAEAGRSLHQQIQGILPAGDYTFALNAVSSSAMDQNGVESPGGEASYNASLSFDAQSYWVTPSGIWNPAPTKDVDVNDLVFVPANFGATYGAFSGIKPVPEPSTIAILLAGVTGLLGLRWPRRRVRQFVCAVA